MLIHLVSIHPSPSPQAIPLACAFLKGYAGQYSSSINLVDFFLGDDAETCAVGLAGKLPDAVGFSMYLWNRQLCCDIAAALRRSYPSIKLFSGGPEVTADPQSILDVKGFDFIVVGEGEVPFLSLCQSLAKGGDYCGIPGVVFSVIDCSSRTKRSLSGVEGNLPHPHPNLPLEGEGIKELLPPPPLKNLNNLPSPYLSGVIDARTHSGILWQLSRGCSFTCDFCFDARGIGGVRHFSLERVEAELRHFAVCGVSQVFVLDSTFNVDQQRAKKILRMIRKIAPDIHFHFEVRSEFIDREMAELFAGIACSLQIGLQSADREVLKLVGRSFNKADFSKKVGLLNETGATFGFDLMYGLPGDTLAGFCSSLDYALSLYPNHLDIFPLAVLPGTRLASHGAKLNLVWNRQPPYLVESSSSFSRGDMAAASELAAACDIFYTRGKAVAWCNAVIALLGITPSHFLERFSAWLIEHHGHGKKELDFSDANVWEMQQDFLIEMFSTKKFRRYLPLLIDLITYHHLYAEVLLVPEASRPPAPPDKILLAISPTARIVHFNYDIEELLECGEPQFRWMYENLAPSDSHAVIYRHNGCVCTETLAPPYIILLENIRDGERFSETGLSREEADEFIAYALQEGIIINGFLTAEDAEVRREKQLLY
jgi:radical SAM superfamily enzyme YgiQ (UPF0313 family)